MAVLLEQSTKVATTVISGVGKEITERATSLGKEAATGGVERITKGLGDLLKKNK
jgi:hypothetical protein